MVMTDAPSSNRAILESLFRSSGINLVRGPIFDAPPDPLPAVFDFQKVEGMMLGLVIGESLGTATEGWLPRKRKLVHGEIRDYLPNKYGFAPAGLASDDMQLAFRTLERMLEDDGFNPERVAEDFSHHHVFGRGFTVRRFISNYRSGLPWYQSGPKSARNGALVRIAPMLIPHLRTATADLWVDTALSAMITHNDAGSTAACLGLVSLLWQLLGMKGPPKAAWWLETFVGVMRQVEGDTRYRARGGKFFGYEGPIWRFVEERVTEAYRAGLSTVDACNQWHSGAFLLETVPSMLYILMARGNDPEEAIVRAVNDTRDNDTIAAIVGAAMGALYGREGLPHRWIVHLPQQTAEQETQRIFTLLADARRRWCP
jgi:ADP-ribosylglycohydrolase